jgi:RimJ/RimL family protein N-acetyltransferase
MGEYRKVPITELETPRLLLRPLCEADAPDIQAQFPHWNVLKYMTAALPWPYPEDGAITFVRSALPRIEACEDYFWAILRKDAPEEGLLGVISLGPGSDENNRGFWLAEAYWGRGYMSEASAAVNDFAFDVLQMKQIIVYSALDNTGSQRIKEKSGAEIIEIVDQPYVSGTLPSARWRLTAEAWAANRRRFAA